MMVDVICAERAAGEALQEVAFLVARAVRADESDGIRPSGVERLLEPFRRGLRGLFPGNRQQFVAFADQRCAQALGMLREIEAKAPFHAEKILVDAGEDRKSVV